jgi:hypothetical protein
VGFFIDKGNEMPRKVRQKSSFCRADVRKLATNGPPVHGKLTEFVRQVYEKAVLWGQSDELKATLNRMDSEE